MSQTDPPTTAAVRRPKTWERGHNGLRKLPAGRAASAQRGDPAVARSPHFHPAAITTHYPFEKRDEFVADFELSSQGFRN